MQPLFAVSLADGVTAGTELLPKAQAAHRARLLTLLDGLPDDEWLAPTRCSAWNVHQVARHVQDVSEFAVALLRRELPDGDLFEGFDPNTTPNDLLARTEGDSRATTMAALTSSFAAETEALRARIDDWTDERSGGPIGETHWSGLATHALWDNWLHERDIAVPLGRDEAPSPEEVAVFAGYSMYIATIPALLGGSDLDVTVGIGSLTVELAPGSATVREGGESTIRGDAVLAAEAVTGRGAPVGQVLVGAPKELTWLASFFNPSWR